MQRNYLPLATYESTNLNIYSYLFIILSCVSHWAHTRLVAHVMHSVPWSASTSRPSHLHSECLSVPMSAAAESKDRGTQWLWEGLVLVSGKSQDGFPIFSTSWTFKLDPNQGIWMWAEVCVRWVSEANVVPSGWLQARAKGGPARGSGTTSLCDHVPTLKSFARVACWVSSLGYAITHCYCYCHIIIKSLSCYCHAIRILLSHYYQLSTIFTKYYEHIFNMISSIAYPRHQVTLLIQVHVPTNFLRHRSPSISLSKRSSSE